MMPRQTLNKTAGFQYAVQKHISIGQLSFCTLSGLCLLLVLCHSDTAISHMGQGLMLCVKTVIPSLFPFMVLSELLVAGGGGELMGRLFEKPVRHLFGISGAGVCALMMGLICGFPVGTKTAVSLCRRGDITPRELSRLICFCNIPSSAFLINAVGVSLFGSRHFGLVCYMVCLISALLTALLWNRIAPLPRTEKSTHPSPSGLGITTFTHAVSSAALAMLYVCAYVVFFSALIGTLGHLLSGLAIGQTATALLFGIFELSGGVLQASAIQTLTAAHITTVILCGWSGISVHLQILSLCDDLTIDRRAYIFSKLVQALLCALLFILLSTVLPKTFFTPTQSVATFAFPEGISSKIRPILNASFIFCLLFVLLRGLYRLRKKAGISR